MGTEEGNWGPGIIGLAATCEALVLIFTVLRIYTRVWIARAFWWDDFTIIMAVVREMLIQNQATRATRLALKIPDTLCVVAVLAANQSLHFLHSLFQPSC